MPMFVVKIDSAGLGPCVSGFQKAPSTVQKLAGIKRPPVSVAVASLERKALSAGSLGSEDFLSEKLFSGSKVLQSIYLRPPVRSRIENG